MVLPKKSLLRRHFFPIAAPIRPWAEDRVANAILSELVLKLLSWVVRLVVSNLSAELRVVSESRLSGRSALVVTGRVCVVVMGVVERVKGLGWLVACVVGGDVRRRVVGF